MRAESSANSAVEKKTPSTTEWLRASQPKPARAYLRQQMIHAEPPPPQRGTKRSYEAFLRSASVEDLAEQCAALAQEKGFTEPYTDEQKRTLIIAAYQRHLENRRARRHTQRLDGYSRRRARKLEATIEQFTRDEIINRDHSTCYLCGAVCDPSDIHLDHVIPLSRGGEHSRDNVRVAFSTCNIRKSDRLLSELSANLMST